MSSNQTQNAAPAPALQDQATLPRYNVVAVATVNVFVKNIAANSVAEAIEFADTRLDFHDLLDNPRIQVGKYDLGSGTEVSAVSWDECCIQKFHVDPLHPDGTPDYNKGYWYDENAVKLVDGQTQTEVLAERAKLAAKFMQEMNAAHDEFAAIAQVWENNFGAETLADLIYLQGAIISGGKTTTNPSRSGLTTIIQALPSATTWQAYLLPTTRL